MFSDLTLEAMSVCKWIGLGLMSILGVSAVVDWPGADAADLAWWLAATVQAAPIVLLIGIAAGCLHIALHMPATRRPDGSVRHRVVLRTVLFTVASGMMLVEATIGGAGMHDISGAAQQVEVSAETQARRAAIQAQLDDINARAQAEFDTADACSSVKKSACIVPHRAAGNALLAERGPLLQQLAELAGSDEGDSYYADAPTLLPWLSTQRQADAFIAAARTYGLQAGVILLAILIAIGSPKPMINRGRSRDGLGDGRRLPDHLPPGWQQMPRPDKARLISTEIVSGRWQPDSASGALTIDSIATGWGVGRATAMLVRQLTTNQGAATTHSAGLAGDRVTLDQSAPGVVLDMSRARRAGQ